MGRTGCGVPRVCSCKQTPGGSGTPPSATTSGRNKRVHARLRRAMELADGEAFLLHPARDRANKPPRWSAERRASPYPQTAQACLRGTQGRALAPCGPTSLARRRVPLHPSACRRSASLVGAREKFGKPRRADASRERRCLCRDLLRRHSGARQRREPGIHTPQPWLWIPGSRACARAPE